MFVFVESGAFRRRTASRDVLADVGFGYFASPEGEEEFAHPGPGGDVCTAITISEPLLAAITSGDLTLPTRLLALDTEAHRRLRRLVTDTRRGSQAWVEEAITLFGGLIRSDGSRAHPLRRPRTVTAHRRLVDGVREALIHDPGLGVTDLAGLLGCSPFHLSRVFSRETGMSISSYRLRLRVREALWRVAAGEKNLARLAVDLGFSDHSHLTRLLVRELGETPTAIRVMR